MADIDFASDSSESVEGVSSSSDIDPLDCIVPYLREPLACGRLSGTSQTPTDELTLADHILDDLPFFYQRIARMGDNSW